MGVDGASERPARIVMIATYVAAGAGLAIAFSTVFGDEPNLAVPTLLTIGAGGILSFVRHALLHRSDAARLGWDVGRANPFQIEVGLANLAWGVVGVLAVALGWGLAVESALFLVFGAYMALVSAFVLGSRAGSRPVGTVIPTVAFAAMLLVVGVAGMAAAPTP